MIFLTDRKIVCTATIVLQSDRVSSSAEFDASLLTITTFSATLIPARSKSSRLQKFSINSSKQNGAISTSTLFKTDKCQSRKCYTKKSVTKKIKVMTPMIFKFCLFCQHQCYLSDQSFNHSFVLTVMKYQLNSFMPKYNRQPGCIPLFKTSEGKIKILYLKIPTRDLQCFTQVSNVDRLLIAISL